MPTVLRRYAGLIRENGGTGCVTGVADLGTQAACTRVVQEAVEAFGGLDLLCNVVDLLRMHALVDVTSKDWRSDEHTSELQSLMRISYAVVCLTQKKGVSVLNDRSEEHTSERKSLKRISNADIYKIK